MIDIGAAPSRGTPPALSWRLLPCHALCRRMGFERLARGRAGMV